MSDYALGRRLIVWGYLTLTAAVLAANVGPRLLGLGHGSGMAFMLVVYLVVSVSLALLVIGCGMLLHCLSAKAAVMRGRAVVLVAFGVIGIVTIVVGWRSLSGLVDT